VRAPSFRGFLDPKELIADNFAGGGGASCGIEAGAARAPDIAINHSAKAIAMHRANHPETKHFCEDIFEVDPRDATAGRPVGLAWFSPDCTHFSRAKGTAPLKKEIRGLAWVVIRWAREVRPRIIMLENVEEFQTWGPLGDDNRPDPARMGETFREWLAELRGLGYAVEYKLLTAADYGTPTTRKRLFLVARRDGGAIVWPQATHGDGRPIRWRAAAEIIDWSLPCPSIFDRKRPLAEATLARIAKGIQRYVIEAANPFVIPVTHQRDSRVHGIGEPLRTITGAHRGELAVVEPFVSPVKTWGGGGNGSRSSRDPLRTVTASKRGEFAIVEPFVVRHGHYSTKTGAGLREGCGAGTFRGQKLEDPLATVCATNDKHLVAPIVTKHYGGVVGHDVRRAIGTVTGKDHHALTAAVIVKQNFGEKPCHGADEPLHTITTQGNKHNLAAAFLSKFYGTSTGAPVDEPAPTVTSGGGKGGGHIAEVRAFLTKFYSAGGKSRSQNMSLFDPVHTLTAKARFGLVTIHGEAYQIVDIGMRMLQPHELFAAQGFPDDYEIAPYFNGKPLTKTDQTELAGNSVCPQVAAALVAANVRQAA
jgi:DNA (cytosine-5)-methyltransferase 1